MLTFQNCLHQFILPHLIAEFDQIGQYFANYMGVSKKTVEAWELGRTHPTGPAYRLISILDQGRQDELSFLSVK